MSPTIQIFGRTITYYTDHPGGRMIVKVSLSSQEPRIIASWATMSASGLEIIEPTSLTLSEVLGYIQDAQQRLTPGLVSFVPSLPE